MGNSLTIKWPQPRLGGEIARIVLNMEEVRELVITAGNSDNTSELPIVVDLDDTLVVTDTLYEQIATGLFTRPVGVLRAFVSLSRGRAALKAHLAREIDLTHTTLPIREDLVEWLHHQVDCGREIHLCSAAAQPVVDTIAARLGIFESATGSAEANLKGKAKAAYLKQRFPEGFTYAGDSAADLAVWNAASGIVLAGVSPSVAKAARNLDKPIEAEFKNKQLSSKDLLKALRVHHWSKNVLIFLPLIFAHAWDDLSLIGHTFLAFICLLMVTSATYLLNDLADLSADRQHWSKRNRALASGRMPIPIGFALAGTLLIVAFASAVVLAPAFAGTLASYLVLTGSYSLGLKRVPLLDTLIIGVLFTIRIIMGIVLISQPSPGWLLTFSVFFFFSLAVTKRHTEIIRAGVTGETHSLASRGYRVEDAPLTLTLGIAAAVASLVVLVLFIIEEMLPASVYSHPQLLAGMPLVLSIWLGRIWLLAHRGHMNDDPVSFALRDRISLALGGIVFALFLAAL
ncbi:UbiA family prenyltransferase [Rhizobium sp. 57MFTsu3.2]|uniref:UbiA family prenyltransferase n=1 Tax=Rhizobium sp. 57MFTsu3.2 TaxID=1048681 RepID=UPI00146C4213|nr:UbiA family prenyltransferase [Rhizobium sp. 57MFTsu3.2]NMN74386.1 4-hydroxybenzoate polyprenyltransferase [Rhizobium sp. 57MFTsu3.2]